MLITACEAPRLLALLDTALVVPCANWSLEADKYPRRGMRARIFTEDVPT